MHFTFLACGFESDLIALLVVVTVEFQAELFSSFLCDVDVSPIDEKLKIFG